LIAFEMARQLAFEGEPPGQLVLIDAYPPASPAYREFDAGAMARCAAFVRDLRSSGQLNSADDPVAVLGQQEFDRRAEVFAAHSHAVAHYRVDEGALAGSGLAVVQLRAVDSESASAAAAADWSKVLGTPVDARPIAADHYTIMSGQALREVVHGVKCAVDRLDMDQEVPT
jgi:thioesterase domain-containing protein